MSARAHVVSGLAPQQLFFEFIPDSERERLKGLWFTHFDKRDRSASKAAEKKRKTLCLKVVEGSALPFSSDRFRSLLETPIGFHTASDLDVQPAPEADEPAPLMVIGPEEGEDRPLTDAQIAEWHEKVLEYYLKLLKSKGNAEEKQDTLRWIWAPSIHGWKQKTIAGQTKLVPIYSRDVPFTFEACCVFSGLRPEDIRSGLAYVLRKFASNAGETLASLGIDIDS